MDWLKAFKWLGQRNFIKYTAGWVLEVDIMKFKLIRIIVAMCRMNVGR